MATAPRVAGVDEAGRGPLAGPLVVAAVILDPARPIAGLADSKTLKPARREALAAQILERAIATSVVVITPRTIDRCNILVATLDGMRSALAELCPSAERAEIDGNHLPSRLPCPAIAIVKGDQTVAAISAASILAKVRRDAEMAVLDQLYPVYQFAKHQGYPTALHRTLLAQHGPCPAHRYSYAPVRAAAQSNEDAC